MYVCMYVAGQLAYGQFAYGQCAYGQFTYRQFAYGQFAYRTTCLPDIIPTDCAYRTSAVMPTGTMLTGHYGNGYFAMLETTVELFEMDTE